MFILLLKYRLHFSRPVSGNNLEKYRVLMVLEMLHSPTLSQGLFCVKRDSMAKTTQMDVKILIVWQVVSRSTNHNIY